MCNALLAFRSSTLLYLLRMSVGMAAGASRMGRFILLNAVAMARPNLERIGTVVINVLTPNYK